MQTPLGTEFVSDVCALVLLVPAPACGMNKRMSKRSFYDRMSDPGLGTAGTAGTADTDRAGFCFQYHSPKQVGERGGSL